MNNQLSSAELPMPAMGNPTGEREASAGDPRGDLGALEVEPSMCMAMSHDAVTVRRPANIGRHRVRRRWFWVS